MMCILYGRTVTCHEGLCQPKEDVTKSRKDRPYSKDVVQRLQIPLSHLLAQGNSVQNI